MVRKVAEKASPSMKAFAAKVFQLRTAKGITQAKLAEALDTTQQMVAKWETGRTEPTIKNIELLASFFGVSIDELLGRNTTRSYDRLLTLATMKQGDAQMRMSSDIVEKLAEFRALVSGEAFGKEVDPLTEEVFRMRKNDPDYFERLADGIAAVVSAQAEGKVSISDLVEAVLRSDRHRMPT